MKVTADETCGIVLEEVYSSLTLRTSEGNEICICMRDDTFEINVCGDGEDGNNWHRVDIDKGAIFPITMAGK